MNEGIQVFSHWEFGNIRAVERDSEPWFIAADICYALDIANPTDALKRLDEDERARFNLGRQGSANVINESGLYSLVLGSRKPEAKTFKRWITHEVVPSIRRTGGYIAVGKDDTPAEIMARALLVAKDTMDRQEKSIEELAPKASFYDAVSASQGDVNVGDLAKMLYQAGYPTGRKRLFAQLQEDGYVMRNHTGDLVPTQMAVELGVLKVRETRRLHGDGQVATDLTTMVTGKGQIYFMNRYVKTEASL